jgi:hypothetical protein
MTTTTLDRVVHWALDADGDSYGDERERLRWYEGMAIAASLQWLAVPWAAAVLVWLLGRPAVLPLAIVLVLMYAPMVLAMMYMHRRHVDTTPRSWRPRTIISAVLGGLPYVIFTIAAIAAYQVPGDSDTAIGAAVGSVIGAGIGCLALWYRSRRRTREESELLEDQD